MKAKCFLILMTLMKWKLLVLIVFLILVQNLACRVSGRDLVGYSREFNITGSVKEEMRQVTETPKVTLKNQLVHIGSANIVPQA